MDTLAAVLCELRKPLQIKRLFIPELKNGQVLVKVAFSGICRSQLNEIEGLKGKDRYLPHTLGHEGSGVVEKITKGVKKVKPGDRVVLTWIKGQGLDAPTCSYIDQAGKIVNSGAISTFITRAVISENRLVKIPHEMPLKEAALLGCAIPTGAGMVFNTAKISAGASVAVFGAGGIGLSALLACNSVRASRIIVVERSEKKINFLKKLGFADCINPDKQDVLSEIMKKATSKGVDYAIEATGNRGAIEMAFESVRDNGGLCVVAGNLPYGEKISIDPFNLIKGKRIIGSWGGDTDPDRDIPKYVKMFLSGKLRLDKILTHTFRMAEIGNALSLLKRQELGRAVIEL